MWPLITRESGHSIRSDRGFVVSVLGPDAANRILGQRKEVKRRLLWQLAMDGGIAGLDLVDEVARSETDPHLIAEAISALSFRAADRRVAAILRAASNDVYDHLSHRRLIDTARDPDIAGRLAAATQRAMTRGETAHERLMAAMEADDANQLTATVGSLEIANYQDPAIGLIFRAHERNPEAVAAGLVERLRAGRYVPHGSSDLIASASRTYDDDQLVDFVRKPVRHDARADTAIAALGVEAVARLLDDFLAVQKQQKNPDGSVNEAAHEYCLLLDHRLQHARPDVLSRAVSRLANVESAGAIAELCGVLVGSRSVVNHGRPDYGADDRQIIAELAIIWGNHLLAQTAPGRGALAAVAGLARIAPLPSLLPLLQRLLDAEIAGLHAELVAARSGRRRGFARTSYSYQYQQAFQAIGDPAVADLLSGYLTDDEFGVSAAVVIRNHWRDGLAPIRENTLRGRTPDYAGVAARRARRLEDPGATSPPAELILGAVEGLVSSDDFSSNKSKQNLAIDLASVAVRVPHGERTNLLQALLAGGDRRSRHALLTSLAWSGNVIRSADVLANISEILEEAKTQRWMLDENRDPLRPWAELLTFTENPHALLDVIAGIPDHLRTPWQMDGVLDALGHSPDEACTDVLFALASRDPRFLQSYSWQQAIARKPILHAGRLLADLIVSISESGGLEGDARTLPNLLGQGIGKNRDLRASVYELYGRQQDPKARSALAAAILSSPDVPGFLMILEEVGRAGRAAYGYLYGPLEKLVTRQEPIEGSTGYMVHSVADAHLRAALLMRTTDGDASDAAATSLSIIDEIRDMYGMPETEPRHPDLQSGRPWPILKPT